jgi:hypothetical protein
VIDLFARRVVMQNHLIPRDLACRFAGSQAFEDAAARYFRGVLV